VFSVKKILCPTDFSDGSFAAISQAIDLALLFGAEVYIINVMQVQPVLPTDSIFAFESPEYERCLRLTIDEHLSELTKPLAARGLRTRTVVGYMATRRTRSYASLNRSRLISS
jgi:nucleotide-binding universal stress UspA family protein